MAYTEELFTSMAVAGAGGQRTLTNADSPYTYKGVITGGKTTTAGILLSGKQQIGKQNTEATPYVNREFDSSGLFDAVWSNTNIITIPSGSVTIYFG